MCNDNKSIRRYDSTLGQYTLEWTTPNENGVIEIPSDVDALSNFYGCYCLSSKIKSIIFDEGFKNLNGEYAWISVNNSITEIDLPSTLKSIYVSETTGSNFFENLRNIIKLTIGGKDSNDNFYIKNNCLVQKSGYNDSSDKYIFGFGNERIELPETVTTLGKGIFRYQSINYLILHKDLKSYVPYDGTSNTFWNTFSIMFDIKSIYYKVTK